MTNFDFLWECMLWMFAPVIPVVIIAILLSLFGFKPPKKKPGQLSWFKDENEW